MIAGRKPKPTALKRLAGNPGKRPLNRAEPHFEGAVTCPRHLSPDAKREWRRLAHLLGDQGLLTPADRAALAAYCQAYGRWVLAERKLAIEPWVMTGETGGLYQSPWVAIANKAMEQMIKIAAEFGMTPSSRSRVKIDQEKEEDPFEAFVRQRLGEG